VLKAIKEARDDDELLSEAMLIFDFFHSAYGREQKEDSQS
jgi:hypothetical protein